MLFFIIHLLGPFLVGALPTGYLVGWYYGRDIRKEGSGNTGATNTARVLGKKAGLLTLGIDIAKGVLGTCIPLIFPFGQLKWGGIGDSNTTDLLALYGLLTVAGHCYSPFLKFKGGKGVATGLGVFLAISWKAVLLAILVFGAVFKLSQIVSLSSILACLTIPAWFLLSTNSEGVEFGDLSKLISVAIAWIIVSRHKSNIKRLIRGNEPKFRTPDNKPDNK